MVEWKRTSQLESFEREVLIHLNTLLKAASRILQSTSEGEDVVQETFLRAWKHFDSFETGTRARAWLFRIMFNVVNARKRKESKIPQTPLDEDTDFEQGQSNVVIFDPLKQIEGQEILEATRQLSEEHRAVLWLVVVEEFSYRETAEILGLPIGTVMSRLHRSRRELRKLVLTRGMGGRAAEG